jgi:multisubunit Na+/H+ antiporter MnhB subunit
MRSGHRMTDMWKAELKLTEQQRQTLMFWMLVACTIGVTVIALTALTELFRSWLL